MSQSTAMNNFISNFFFNFGNSLYFFLILSDFKPVESLLFGEDTLIKLFSFYIYIL